MFPKFNSPFLLFRAIKAIKVIRLLQPDIFHLIFGNGMAIKAYNLPKSLFKCRGILDYQASEEFDEYRREGSKITLGRKKSGHIATTAHTKDPHLQ